MILIHRCLKLIWTLAMRLKQERFFWSRYSYAKKFLAKHPMPPLDQSDKESIDAFWRNFGIKFTDYSWFQMFYGVTGIKTPEFVPHPIARALFSEYNNTECIRGWDDKNMYEKILPNLRFPDSLCHCMKGRLYDEQWNNYGNLDGDLNILSQTIIRELGEQSEVILKKTSSTLAGQGVRKYQINCANDIKELLIKNISFDFILQKCIKQHPFFSQFCKTSVNIVRIITYKVSDNVELLSASLRYGENGSYTDVSYINGKEIVNVVGIDEQGQTKEYVIRFDGKHTLNKDLVGLRVPLFNELVHMAKVAHQSLYYFDLVGWDFTVSIEGDPICIEYNVLCPGTVLYQFANGPFAGDLSADFLSPLNKKSVRALIPKKLLLS